MSYDANEEDDRRHPDTEDIQELPDFHYNCRGRLDHILHRLPVFVMEKVDL